MQAMSNAWVPNVSPALSTLSLLLLQQTNGWPLNLQRLLTLNVHAQEVYGTCLVCTQPNNHTNNELIS